MNFFKEIDYERDFKTTSEHWDIILNYQRHCQNKSIMGRNGWLSHQFGIWTTFCTEMERGILYIRLLSVYNIFYL